MQDNKTLNPEQTTISDCVVNKYSEINKTVITYNICPVAIDECIVKLKRNSSPGIDNITAEFLLKRKHAKVLIRYSESTSA